MVMLTYVLTLYVILSAYFIFLSLLVIFLMLERSVEMVMGEGFMDWIDLTF